MKINNIINIVKNKKNIKFDHFFDTRFKRFIFASLPFVFILEALLLIPFLLHFIFPSTIPFFFKFVTLFWVCFLLEIL